MRSPREFQGSRWTTEQEMPKRRGQTKEATSLPHRWRTNHSDQPDHALGDPLSHEPPSGFRTHLNIQETHRIFKKKSRQGQLSQAAVLKTSETWCHVVPTNVHQVDQDAQGLIAHNFRIQF
eukprot:6467318-Amphidinium_carterae.1